MNARERKFDEEQREREKMGSCGSKPKVLKDEDDEAPIPAPSQEVGVSVPKANEVVVASKDKDIVDDHAVDEPGIKRRRPSLGDLFKEVYKCNFISVSDVTNLNTIFRNIHVNTISKNHLLTKVRSEGNVRAP